RPGAPGRRGRDGSPGPAPARRPRLPRVEALGLVLGGPDGGRVAGRTWVRHEVAGAGAFRVSSDGFWQVHAAAAPTLVRLVREAAALRPHDTVLDLYAGAGLLSLALAGDLGPDGSVVAVESDPSGVADLRRNAHDEPRLRVVAARVEHALDDVPTHVDVVVLDPPRAGAGAAVLDRLAALGPRRVVVVSCDPAALGRDTALLAERGYRLGGLRALDAFPMTHHVECVATYDLIS
uniref:class I SAM-dependent RNA methyltransferase n=1 Tax=Aquipuribacter sp. SD81 TaxID=3127703 RepID=UPI00301B0399